MYTSIRIFYSSVSCVCLSDASTASESLGETYEITLYNKCVNTMWPFKLLTKETPDNIPKEKAIDYDPYDRKTIKRIERMILASSIDSKMYRRPLKE